MPTIATHFHAILFGLRAVIDAHARRDRDRARAAMLVLLWSRIGRMSTRFETLFAKWRAGTLPKPRPSRTPPPPMLMREGGNVAEVPAAPPPMLMGGGREGGRHANAANGNDPLPAIALCANAP